MSAFLVNDTHIDHLIAVASCGPSDAATPWERMRWYGFNSSSRHEYSDNEVGQMLLDANLRSLEARYPDYPEDWREVAHTFEHRLPSGRLSTVQALKTIQCFAYQACEVEDWRTSDAAIFCDCLTGALIQHMPGYESAAWDIPRGGNR